MSSSTNNHDDSMARTVLKSSSECEVISQNEDSPKSLLRKRNLESPPHTIIADMSDNARTILFKRFARRDSNDEPIEKDYEIFWRVAKFIGDVENKLGFDFNSVNSNHLGNTENVDFFTKEFYNILTSLDFLPNSPTFMGAGTALGQLAACFVLPIEDDMGGHADGIFQTLRNAALIQQTGGGNGFSFSRLRPKNSLVNSSMGKASGPVGFLRVYDQAFGEIAQGGTRRGANMAVLRCDHPDIMEFIGCKDSENAITNFNISVGITDKFMKAVKNDEMFDLINPQDGKVNCSVNACDIFDKIAEGAHRNGEPGILFLDEANRSNPVPHLYTLESTNPCITADTIINTTAGPKRVDELIGKQFDSIYSNMNGGKSAKSTHDGFFSTGFKDVFKLTLETGHTLRLTADHKVLTLDITSNNGCFNIEETFIPAKDLKFSHDIVVDNPNLGSQHTKMVSFEPDGHEEVYDCTIPITHRFSANGVIVHNCGEQWLGPYESCCLGSINLSKHIDGNGGVNWSKLKKTIDISVRFLDNVITANNFVPAVPQLKQSAEECRRIGLGIMGLADLMYHCGITYGSDEGIEFGSQAMEYIQYHAMLASINLATLRGPFPGIKGSIYDPANMTWEPKYPLSTCRININRPSLDWNTIIQGIRENGIRNAAQITIAPTGSLSTVTDCEGYGCEPVFALAYIRHLNDNGVDRLLHYISPELKRALTTNNMSESEIENIIKQISSTGTLQTDNIEIPTGSWMNGSKKIKDVFVTSGDISWENHIRQQASLQRFVDNSISKTINMPNSATIEDVKKAYLLAHELGCKGLTIYRTGSRDKVVLETQMTFDTKEMESDGDVIQPKQSTINPQQIRKKRPQKLIGSTYRVGTPLGVTYVTINEDPNDPGEPFEVFLQASKGGSDTAAVTEALGRLISQVLRLNSPISPKERLADIVQQLNGIGGQRSLGLGPKKVRSLPDGISKMLREYLISIDDTGKYSNLAISLGNSSISDDVVIVNNNSIGDLCPECGNATYIFTEGCRKCTFCGLSEC